jgi:hypothetical protein
MKATHADPPCWGQHSAPERSRPPRGEQYWSLSKSLCDMSRAQGDDESTDQGRWHVGNVFESLDQAEQAYDKRKAVWLPVHQDPASPLYLTLLIRTVCACSPLSALRISTDVSFLEKKFSS